MQTIPAFCSRCGRPLNHKQQCECGHVIEQVGTIFNPAARAAAPPPIGLWLRLTWGRLVEVVRLTPASAEMPLEASLVSIGVRALLMALLIDRTTNAATVGFAQTLQLPVVADMLNLNLFLWTFLALAGAAGVSLMIIHWQVGKAALPAYAAVLADSHWPSLIGVASAWVLSHIWLPLALVALPVGVAWGQLILTNGIDQLRLPFRKRMALHFMITAASTTVVLIVLSMSSNKL